MGVTNMRFSAPLLLLASATLYLCDATIVIDAFIVTGDGIDVANDQVEDKHLANKMTDDGDLDNFFLNSDLDELQLANNFVKKFEEALPPVAEESLTAKKCPCNKLLLSSLGPAKDHLSGVMGVYTKYGEYNSTPAYFGPNSARLYFLPNGWLVSDGVGKPTGFIHNGNKSRSLCAYEIPSGWLFFSAQWYEDTTLVLRCIN